MVSPERRPSSGYLYGSGVAEESGEGLTDNVSLSIESHVNRPFLDRPLHGRLTIPCPHLCLSQLYSVGL